MHDPDFRQSERDWFSFVEKVTEKLVEIDETVPELPVKDVVRLLWLKEAYQLTRQHRSSGYIETRDSHLILLHTR